MINRKHEKKFDFKGKKYNKKIGRYKKSSQLGYLIRLFNHN